MRSEFDGNDATFADIKDISSAFDRNNEHYDEDHII